MGSLIDSLIKDNVTILKMTPIEGIYIQLLMIALVRSSEFDFVCNVL